MSKLFSACVRSPKLTEDVRGRDSTQPKVESRIPTPKSPAASRSQMPTKKPKPGELSPRRTAIVNARKSNLKEQKAKKYEQPELNIFRGLNLKMPPQGPHMDPDPFVGIPEVFGISENVENKRELFHSFLAAKEAAMVLFYNPDGPRSNDAKLRFQQAATTTNRQNHAYAAINCTELPGICSSQSIRSLPTYKLYSYGKFVGHYDDFLTTADDLKLYTETSPVAELPFKETPPPCPIQ